jgi:hypothetical protein
MDDWSIWGREDNEVNHEDEEKGKREIARR